MIIDFHTHTLLSDGLLLPAEAVRQAEARGYRAIGLTDHADFSNVERVVAAKARQFGIPLVVASDAHSADDLLTPALWKKVGHGAGLGEEEWRRVEQNSRTLLERIGF